MVRRCCVDFAVLLLTPPCSAALVSQVYQSVSGLHHPDTFNCLTSLVALLRGAGKASQALPLAQRCLAVKKKSLGELHPDTAASMQVVADVMLDLGRWVLASLAVQHMHACTVMTSSNAVVRSLLHYLETLASNIE